MAKKKTTAIAPVKAKEMSLKQAIASFNDYEAKIYKELSDNINKHVRETINWYWDLGVRLTAIQDDAKKNKEHYGNAILPRLCTALGFKTTNQLYSAMDVVKAFGTKKSFTEYVKLAGEAGNRLSWSHLVVLAGVADTSTRLELAATALEQAWTVETLHEQVRKLVERKSRGIRQKALKAKIPASVKKCLQHVTSRAEDFIYQFKTAWTGDAFNLIDKVEDLPASSLDDKLIGDIESTRERVKELIESATTMEAELANANTAVRRKLAAQAQADADAEAAAAAAAEEEEEAEEDEEAPAEEEESSENIVEDDEDDNTPFEDEEEAQEEDEEVVVVMADDEEDEAPVAPHKAVPAIATPATDARNTRAIERARERAKRARAT